MSLKNYNQKYTVKLFKIHEKYILKTFKMRYVEIFRVSSFSCTNAFSNKKFCYRRISSFKWYTYKNNEFQLCRFQILKSSFLQNYIFQTIRFQNIPKKWKNRILFTTLKQSNFLHRYPKLFFLVGMNEVFPIRLKKSNLKNEMYFMCGFYKVVCIDTRQIIIYSAAQKKQL